MEREREGVREEGREGEKRCHGSLPSLSAARDHHLPVPTVTHRYTLQTLSYKS